MRKIGDVMKELGFKEGASEDVARAFVKNLIRQAYGVDVVVPPTPPYKEPEQLSFDLGDEPRQEKIIPSHRRKSRPIPA